MISTLVVMVAACATPPEQTSQTPPDTTTTTPTGATNSPASDFSNQTFAQQIEVQNPINSGRVRETITLPVTVRNTSNFVWQSQGSNPVRLSYHWLDANGGIVVFEGERTNLPSNLPPQESTQLDATVGLPETPGEYTLSLSMVQEGVVWFNDAGAPAAEIPVTVTAQ